MKKINTYLASLLVLFLITSCENDNKIAISEIDYISFETLSLTLNVDPSGTASQDIKVYTSTISNRDRQYNISVETTAASTAYSVPSTVTIPANTNVGTIVLDANGEFINANGDTIVLEFTNDEGLFSGENITINLKAFCPFELSDVVGTWTGTTSYGHPTQMVTSINSSGQLVITGIAVGFMENDWGEVITSMNELVVDVDLETGTFTIAEAPYMTTTYNGAVQDPYYLVGTGTFTVCSTIKIDLDYDLIQAGTSYTQWLTIGNGYPPFEEHNTL